ncbi:NTP transferase domain-containing protein [Halobellus ruber]|uniref:NTP transferase domain-containing protein n=1 Tax=Halobellus ruber TaxID=2761102 RepID=A0A7J9SN47_9EURY|nr:NTP transferase domain-containing protein [Halobellus ruber]MBB6647556.1 NTP transferase domain-containing protein [Halobellus ruber]
MDALVMCGGRGTRLRGGDDSSAADGADVEKPLVEVGGASMLSRVVGALRASGVGSVHAAVSPQAPETADRARSLSVPTVETPGDGYVSDLRAALDAVGRPAVTVPADLPLLAPAHVDDAIGRSRRGGEDAPTSLTVCVPAALKRRLGASVDAAFDNDGRTVAPTGLNVVADGDDTVALTYDARLAVNVNRPEDLELAEALCG